MAQIQVQIAGQIDVLYWNLFFVALSFFAVGNQISVKKSGLKWTVLGQSGRSRGVKLDGPKEGNWTVKRDESRRSKKLKVDGLEGST